MKKKYLRIIRMTLFYSTLSICLQCIFLQILIAGDLKSQSAKSVKQVYLEVEFEDAQLLEVFREVENKTEYKFFFDKKDDFLNKKFNLKRGTLTVENLLLAVAKESDVKFRQVNNNISVFGKGREQDSILEVEIMADVEVSGTITDENGAGLPGASVIEKGTTNGTTTDLEGNYRLSLSDDATLVVSFVGYKTSEIILGGRSTVDVQMELDSEQLEEIVVVGYGTAKKKDLTGAIASVDLDKTRTIPNTNAVQSLRGTIAGVTVTDNGRPGSDASIQIRGRNSITASNAPLIVLDGIIYAGGRLSDINPGDIESIHILKDASSTAIYGSLAANGVIEITTKKGSTDKPTISLNTYYGSSDYAHIPDYLNAEEYLAARKDAEIADGGAVPFQPIELENIAAGKTIEPFEEIKQNAPMFNGELSVSGRTEDIKYYMSGSYANTKSPVMGDNFSRLSGRLNLDAAVTDWLAIGLNTGYTSRDNSGNRANLAHASWLSPYASLYYDDGVPRKQPQDLGLVSNPLYATLWNQNESKQKTLFVNTYADVQLPLKGLSYRLNVGYTQRNDIEFNYSPSYNRDEFFNLGSGNKNHYEARNLTLENILKYSKFLGHHEINATLMYGIYELHDESSYLSSNNVFNDALGWNALEIGENFNINTGAGESQQVSSMGRIGYRYKGKYIFDVSLRRDGYSAFGEGNKYGIFPAVGASWNLIDEDFMAGVELIDNLKLRVSWGKNGNRGVGRYSSLSNVNSTKYTFGDGTAATVGLYPTSFANPNLGWETTTSTNIGIDFGIFSSRISGSIEYYRSNTSNLLLSQKIPNTNGFETFLRNIGGTSNRGVELSLNFTNIQTGEFTWSSNVAFTMNRNKIQKLTGNDLDEDGIEDDDIASKWFIGEPLGSNFDYVFDGIYQEGNDFSAIPGTQAGHIKFKDIDNDGVITPDDRQVIHSDQPSFTMGITNSLSYKGFNLMAVLNIRQGGYSANSAINPGTNFYDLANIFDLPYWTPDNPINTHAAINYKNPLGYGFYQSRSFVRLQDVSLSYSIPSIIVEKASLGSVQVYVSGKNLATWTDWIGWDPEHGAGGLDPGNNGPLMKTYTIGVNIQF
ncbi:TonB-dependent receptor [Reichenbachiella sp. MALMAid0571]|uniref:SusC/RagA family TonB-linked outer membrane protein n=1 Tax=Reichenbachiella sp. MALMAid0571 TaxID=3143939 RepID=UPI0032DF3676